MLLRVYTFIRMRLGLFTADYFFVYFHRSPRENGKHDSS